MKPGFFMGLSSAVYHKIADTFEKTRATAEASRIRLQMECLQEDLDERYLMLGREYYLILMNSDTKGNNKACLSISRLTSKLDTLSKMLESMDIHCPEERPYVAVHQPDILEEPDTPPRPLRELENMSDSLPNFTADVTERKFRIRIRTKKS